MILRKQLSRKKSFSCVVIPSDVRTSANKVGVKRTVLSPEIGMFSFINR